MEVNQFIPTLAAGDAISLHARRVQRVLRGAGFDSEIFADDIHDGVRGKALDFRQYDRRGGGDPRWILFHSSTGSPLTDYVLDRDDPLLVDYHNITPAKFFRRWEPDATANMELGRTQLKSLAQRARLGIADSSYNEADLKEAGFGRTVVCPILVDFAEYDRPPRQRTLARLRKEAAGGARWLFVGRLSPNKCQHDVIAAFAVYRRLFDRRARLSLVGGGPAPLYRRALAALARELEVGEAVELTDAIVDADVLAHFAASDVLVCLSEHEGFNVPVLEAMHFDVPVVAYACCAVPETVGHGGILLDDKDPLTVASAVHQLLTDEPRRRKLVEGGRERVEHFSLANTERRMLEAITAEVGQEAGQRA